MAALALLVSLALVLWAVQWIALSLRRLSTKMRRSVNDIDLSCLAEIKRKDEIEELARRFNSLLHRIRKQISNLEHLSVIDALTGLGSRHFYEASGGKFIKQVNRSANCLGMLVCDVDNFKRYNDCYGHPSGDEVLQKMGNIFTKELKRDGDFAFRIGGEEFLALIEVGSTGEVENIAEKLRAAVVDANISHVENQPYGRVTISLGCVAIVPAGDSLNRTIDDLFEMADQELYKAKGAGRNRVSMRWCEETFKPNCYKEGEIRVV